MPSDPTLQFRIYVYIQLIVTKLGIFKGVTSHSHMITNITVICILFCTTNFCEHYLVVLQFDIFGQ